MDVELASSGGGPFALYPTCSVNATTMACSWECYAMPPTCRANRGIGLSWRRSTAGLPCADMTTERPWRRRAKCADCKLHVHRHAFSVSEKSGLVGRVPRSTKKKVEESGARAQCESCTRSFSATALLFQSFRSPSVYRHTRPDAFSRR